MWLAYAKLFRIGNVFTALADILMGFAVTQHGWNPLPQALLLLVASGLLYTAGMILNDVFDLEKDRLERPDRPLPSGAIPLARAQRMGWGMLMGGVVLAGISGWLPGAPAGSWPWRPLLVATALATCIVLYDGVLKNTVLGPFMMGGCRVGNVLLGMSLGAAAGADAAGGQWASYYVHQWLVAGGVGTYIVGVTWFARTEASASARSLLGVGVTLMLVGFAMLAWVYHWLPAGFRPWLRREESWFLLLGIVGFTVIRRCVLAIADPQPLRVQLAVAHAVLSLIMIDAAVTLLMAGVVPACIVVSLLLPAFVIGRWLYTT